jgi:hypothetical protein
MSSGLVSGQSMASPADVLVAPPTAFSSPSVFNRMSRFISRGVRYPAYELPRTLFLRGEQGAWYDPSDLSTMFQDALGNVPVTGVEQPVRRILDKSGNNHHATASADARRPVLSARVNLLLATEDWTNAAWAISGVPTTANTGIAPNGTQTADTIEINSTTILRSVRQDVTLASGTNATFSVWARLPAGSTATAVRLSTNNSIAWSTGASQRFTLTSDWQLLSLAGVLHTGSSTCRVTIGNADVDGNPDATVATGTIEIWGADLRVTNDGVNLPAYQRVTSSTDYDTAGFPLYLRFDGTDDCLFTGNIDFSATDEVTVCAGVRKLSDAAIARIAELSATTATTDGSFALGVTTLGRYTVDSRGTTQVGAGEGAGTSPVPITNVLTQTARISAPVCSLRNNGVQTTTITSSQGTGNYGNHPLYIGARADASQRLNGRLYQLVVRGALTGTPVLGQLEGFVNAKTRAF